MEIQITCSQDKVFRVCKGGFETIVSFTCVFATRSIENPQPNKVCCYINLICDSGVFQYIRHTQKLYAGFTGMFVKEQYVS